MAPLAAVDCDGLLTGQVLGLSGGTGKEWRNP